MTQFCNNLDIPMNPQNKKLVLEKLKNMVNVRKPKIYNFDFSERSRDIYELKKKHYLLTFETNGAFFFLFLTTIEGKKYSLFIHYDNPYYMKIYNVKLRFNIDLYNDTIIDGEILKNNQDSWVFMLNNILYYKGEFVGNKYLGERISLLSEILRNNYKFDDFLNPCHLQLRSYFLFNHLEMLSYTHNNKLLMVPEYPKNRIYCFSIKNLTDNEKLITLLSLNPDNLPFKKFFVEKTEVSDVFKLYDSEYYKLIENMDKNSESIEQKSFQGIACISTMSQSFYMKKLFDEMDSNQKGIWIKFKYNNHLEGWEPYLS